MQHIEQLAEASRVWYAESTKAMPWRSVRVKTLLRIKRSHRIEPSDAKPVNVPSLCVSLHSGVQHGFHYPRAAVIVGHVFVGSF